MHARTGRILTPIAILALVGGLAWLDWSRLLGAGSIAAALGFVSALRTVRLPDVLMTAGVLVLATGFLVNGVWKLASAHDAPVVWEVALVVFLLLAAAGFLRFRRRVGGERASEWFFGLIRELVPPLPARDEEQVRK